MKKRLYIAYGSNLNIQQMAKRCPTAKLVATGKVDGYELQFKGSPHGAFATIGRKDGAFVPVAVWSLQPNDEISLDSYEGYPFHYYKSNLPVLLDNGTEIKGMVYIMNQRMDFGMPTQHYYDTVYEGYKNCGLDTKILNQAVESSIDIYHERVKSQEKMQGKGATQYTWDWNQLDDNDEDFVEDPEESDPYQMQF